MRNAKRKALVMAAMSVAGLVRMSYAANQTWQSAPGANDWSAANWNTGGAASTAAPGDELVFATSNTTNLTNDFGAGTTFAGLSFNTGASAFTLGGASANFTGGVAVNSAVGTQTINLGFTAAGSITMGTDQSGANNLVLNANDVAGGLFVNSNSSTANTLNIGAGDVLALNGTSSIGFASASATGPSTSLTITGNELDQNGNLIIGLAETGSPRSTTTVNMSGLNTFRLNASTSTGSLGFATSQQATGTFLLASASPSALNVLTAATLNLSNTTANAGTANLFLGQGSNIINANQINIGLGKGTGTINWQSSSSGSLLITGAAGGASTANFLVGVGSSATSGGTSQMLFAGHLANIQAGTVILGELTGGVTGGSPAANVTFDTGAFSIGTLTMANDLSGTAANGSVATLTVGGATPNNTATGVSNVNNAFNLGVNTNNSATPAKATFTMNGGTANINSDIEVNFTTASGLYMSAINVAGGTLNMMGHQIGNATHPITVNLPTGTQTANLVSLGGGGINSAGLNMTGSGTLIISGANSYLGGTTINSGRLIALTNLPAGAVALNGGTLAGISSIGNLTMQGGTEVVPGSTTIDGSIGTLTMNSLTVNGGDFRLDISANAGGSDLIAVTGGATFSGGSITPVFSGTPAPGNYTLLTSGSLNINTAPTINVPSSQTRLAFTPHFGDATSGANNISLSIVGAAANLTWTGTPGDGTTWDIVGQSNWTSAARTDGTDPTKYYDLDNVNFLDGPTSRSITLNTTVSPTSVTINNSVGNDYSFSGGGAIGGPASVTKSGTGIATLALNDTYSGLTSVNNGTLAITANQTTTGTIVINGGTLLALANLNSTAPITTNSGGTLVFGNGGTSGNTAATSIVDNGVIIFNRSDNPFTFASPISGSGIVQQGVAGGPSGAELKLTGTNTYTGATNILSGIVQAGGSGSNSNTLGNTNPGNGPVGNVIISSGAALDIGGGATGNSLNFGTKGFIIAGTGPGTSPVGAIINTGNQQENAFENISLAADSTVGGNRMDIGRNGTGDTLDLVGHRLTVAMNSGTIFAILNGVNVTSGTIEVSSGGLDLERAVNVPSDVNGSNIILDNGTNLQLFETASGSVTRPIVADGNNTIGGGDNTTAILDAPITFTGSDLNFDQLASGAGTNNGTGTLLVNGNITQFGGNFAIQKNGNSTLVLAGSNTFSNALNINGGTVILGSVNALGGSPSVNLNGNGLRLGGTTITIPALSGGGVVSNGSSTPATLTLPSTSGNSYGIDAALQDGAGGGPLSVTVAGSGTVSFHSTSNTFTGTTTISSGTLEVQNTLSNGAVVNNSALYFNSGGTIVYGGNISGGGIIRQVGGGTTIFTGSHSFTSAMQIDNGTLIVNGSMPANGTVNLNTDQGSPNLAGIGTLGNVVVGPNGGGSQAHISPGALGDNSVGSITMSSLNLIGGNPDFKLDLLTPANTDFVNVTGAATFSVASTLSPSAEAAAGTYTVLTAQGGLHLSVTPTINSPTDTRSTFTLDTTSDPNSLKLVAVNHAISLTWRGDQGNSWDVNNTTNWTDNGTSTDQKFFQLDSVTFDDSNLNDNNVNISQAVFPTSIEVNNSSSDNYTFNGGGTISGNTGLTKDGNGTLTVQVSYNYAGATTVNNGTLIFSSLQPLAGPIVINGGTLQLGTGGSSGVFPSGGITDNGMLVVDDNGATNPLTINTSISGTGGLEKASNGTLLLAANQSYSGITQIDSGTVLVGAGTTSGSLGSGSVTNNGTLIFDRSDAVTVASVISGSGSLVKIAANTLSLTGSNTYSGSTTISAGTLIINSANSLGDFTQSSNTISIGGATLDLAAGSGTVDLGTNRNVSLTSASTLTVAGGSKLTVDGNITGTATTIALGKNGSGTLVLSGNNSFGVLSILSGTLDFSSDANLGGTGSATVLFGGSGFAHPVGNVTSGKFFYDNNSASDQVNFLIDSGATFTLNRAAGGIRNTNNKMATVQGGGTLLLAAANPQLDDGLLMNAGTVVLQIADSAGGVSGGNTIELNSNTAAFLQADTSTVFNNAAIASGSTRFIANGNNTIYVDRQTAGAGVTHTVGSLAFNTGGFTQTFTPGSNITSGTAGLIFAQGGILNDNGTFNVLNSTTSVVPMTVTMAAPITGSFGITMTGTGTLDLSSSNAYTGSTTINGGALLVDTAGSMPVGGAVNNNAAFFVYGSTTTGAITGTGTTTVGNGTSTNTLALATNSGGSTQGGLTINTGASLDITNNHMAISYTPGNDPTTTLVSYIAAAYDNGAWDHAGLTSSAAEANHAYAIAYSDDTVNDVVTLKYDLGGDANLDGKVNASDFDALAAHYGTNSGGVWTGGDFNYDGIVNTLDFNILAANYNQVATGTAAPSLGTLVPEPGSLAMIAGIAGALSARRRRK